MDRMGFLSAGLQTDINHIFCLQIPDSFTVTNSHRVGQTLTGYVFSPRWDRMLNIDTTPDPMSRVAVERTLTTSRKFLEQNNGTIPRGRGQVNLVTGKTRKLEDSVRNGGEMVRMQNKWREVGRVTAAGETVPVE